MRIEELINESTDVALDLPLADQARQLYVDAMRVLKKRSSPNERFDTAVKIRRFILAAADHPERTSEEAEQMMGFLRQILPLLSNQSR